MVSPFSFVISEQMCYQMCAPGTKPNGSFEQLLQKRLEVHREHFLFAESVKAQMWQRLTKQGMDSGEVCGH